MEELIIIDKSDGIETKLLIEEINENKNIVVFETEHDLIFINKNQIKELIEFLQKQINKNEPST